MLLRLIGLAVQRSAYILRREKLFKNTVVGVIAQFITLFTGLVVQTVFVRCMIDEYLGARGLFTSVLSVLSLAELGIGTVLVYSMYEPIAQNDERKLIALIRLYRKAYNIVALAILVVGLVLVPFLPFLINDMDSVPHATLIYLLYLMNSVLSYIYIYKTSILNADQKGYIVNVYTAIFSLVQCVGQIAVLVITHNFFVYMVIQIACTVLKNVAVSIQAEKMYAFLKSKEKIDLSKKEKRAIFKNVFAMFNHRVGSTVLTSTDNIIISKFIGLVVCGYYYNFKLIVDTLNGFINQFFNSMLSSVGNMLVMESRETSYRTFKYLHFLSFWIYTFCTICFIEMVNPFVLIWLGDEKYLFDNFTVIMIGLNFYVIGIRKVPLVFKEAMGLLWNDRFKPIVESVLNIVISIVLIQSLGVAGIFFGTIISMVLTSLWVEPYVLFKYGFEMSTKEFWKRNIIYFIVSGITITLTHLAAQQLAFTGWADLLSKFGVCLIIPNVIILLLFFHTREFKDLMNAFGAILSKFFNRHKKTAVE